MASRSHYQRKAQVAYEASVQKARANLFQQQRAPDLYAMFASGSPSFGPMRGGFQGKGSNPRNLHLWGPIGTNRACNGCSYSPGSGTPYFSFDGGQYNKSAETYASIASSLKPKALAAEMGGIAKANKHLSNLLSSGPRQVSSRRKQERNTANIAAMSDKQYFAFAEVSKTDPLGKVKAKNEKEKRIETYGWDPYETSNFFGATRDQSGQLKKHEAKNYLDTTQMTKEEKVKFTIGTLESVAAQSTAVNIKSQRKEEVKLEKELAAINKELSTYKMNYSSKDGTPIYKVTSASQALTQKKLELQSRLQDINNDQAVATSSLAALDYNTMMRYLSKNDVISDATRKNYLSVSDPSLAVLEQEVQASNYAWQQQKTKTSATASEIRKLEGLQKNITKGGYSVAKQNTLDKFVLSLENKYGDQLDTQFDNSNNSIEDVLKQLNNNILSKSKNTQADLRADHLSAASTLSKKETTEQRMARATNINKMAESKREFEELTGMEAGTNADRSMADWYESIGSTRPDQYMKGYAQRDTGTSDWFSGWLQNDTMLARDASLTLWGEQDQSGYSGLSGKKGILDKYDAWDQANQYIGEDLHALKGDLNQYYGSFYSSPSVTTQDVSKILFGSPTVEGDSFIGHVNQQMGGVRGGAYWVGDIKKLSKKTKEHEKTMVEQIEARKLKLIELELERSRLDESHKALRPEITAAVASGVKHGSGNVDSDLQKRIAASSQELFDTNEQVALAKVEQEYLEKSLKLTIGEREELEKQRKIREYNQLQSNVGSGAPRVGGYSSPGRPSLKQVSRTNTGSSGINTQQSKQRIKRRNSLGGLVK